MSKVNTRVEDDLDELDDIVEQFTAASSVPTSLSAESASKSKSEKNPVPGSSATTSSSSQRPLSSATSASASTALAPATPGDGLPDEFAKQLVEGMESLMRELTGSSGDDLEKLRERQAAWEKVLVDGMNGADVTDDATDSGRGNRADAASEDGAGLDPFAEGVKKTMERLRDSDSTLHTESASKAPSTDPLEALLGQLGSNLDENGQESEELQGMLETMMRQLMSKEVLYEPLKELHEKFPSYLTENAAHIAAEDKSRYENQLDRVTQILTIFELPNYSDEDTNLGGEVVRLMNEMQSFGSPPAQIMGPLPPGLDLSADGDSKLPEGCIIS